MLDYKSIVKTIYVRNLRDVELTMKVSTELFQKRHDLAYIRAWSICFNSLISIMDDEIEEICEESAIERLVS